MLYYNNQTNTNHKYPLTKGEVVRLLRGHLCSVLFTKANGETRKMICTLQEKYLPPMETTVEQRETTNNTAVPCWDIEKEAWRSFRVDSVRELHVLD